MANSTKQVKSEIANERIKEALAVLTAVGLPREQLNERSALTLLALTDVKPATNWEKAASVRRGVTEMMQFMAREYRREYKPNTRETVRRYTLHQFVQAGIALINSDDPSRPTNSPKTVYCAAPSFLKLLQSYGKPSWEKSLRLFLVELPALSTRYAEERKTPRVNVRIARGKTIALSPGGQNTLVKLILDDFCSFYTPKAKVVYVGDTAHKWAYFDEKLLKKLGVVAEKHGKMPDVVVFLDKLNWLVLIEAVTSHGPVTPKRKAELKEKFKGASAGLVFVSAFADHRTLLKYLSAIAWETEVWVAEHPTHIIHLNGKRFLGPYDD